ncbi:MFS transporter, partial [Streptomyces sp. SID685]
MPGTPPPPPTATTDQGRAPGSPLPEVRRRQPDRARPAEAGAGAEAPRRAGVALVASLLGFTVITIDVSAVNIALPSIRESLDGGMAGLQWVVDAYTLMFAALMLSAGAIADRAGARRAYAWGVALFTLASLGCALAPGIGVLVAARVAQGGA